MPRSERYLRIHNFAAISEVNGPGKRSVIWTQGCPLDCAGCFNQAARRLSGGEMVSIMEIIQRIPRAEVEGITFSGGEPFWQAAACTEIARLAHGLGLSVLVYTGFPLPRIHALDRPEWKALVAEADILIDGPYKPHVPPVHLWAGSGNQQVHYLSSRYVPGETGELADVRKCEFVITKEGSISVTGFPEGIQGIE